MGLRLNGDGFAVRTCSFGGIELGQAEVEDFEATVLRHPVVVRLEIAVNDSCIVGGDQSARQLHAIIQHLPLSHRAFTKALTQGLALQQLADDVWRSVVLADVKNRNYVGMVQGGGGLGFLLKAAQTFGIA